VPGTDGTIADAKLGAAVDPSAHTRTVGCEGRADVISGRW
jgi:hypothetical protein